MNHFLGSFSLRDIPPQLAGQTSIRVSFEIDINGMLNVSAIDKDTGNENSIEIELDKRLTNTEKTRLEVRLEKYFEKMLFLKIYGRLHM